MRRWLLRHLPLIDIITHHVAFRAEAHARESKERGKGNFVKSPEITELGKVFRPFWKNPRELEREQEKSERPEKTPAQLLHEKSEGKIVPRPIFNWSN